MKQWIRDLIVMAGMISVCLPLSGQNIFPGAEGQGTHSRGAYGGDTLPRIVYVDNLRSAGPGSFREAVSGRGPRIVLFNVSGTIKLSRALFVSHPYLFVAGQSAPGKGISLEGAPFIIRTHDVLIQDMRFRLGASYPRQSDCVSLGGGGSHVFNVVFDRCSFAFGLDENLGIFRSGPGITISHSIVGYGLNKFGHSCGVLALASEGVSLIRNVMAFNRDRNPNIRGDSRRVEIINNLIYDSGAHAVYLGSRGPVNAPLDVLLEGNLYVTGVDNMNRYLLSVHEQVPDSLRVYWNNNLTVHEGRVLDGLSEQVLDDSRRFLPVEERPFEASVNEVLPAAELLSVLPDMTGARPANRDTVDQLIFENIRNQTGRIIDQEDQLGELPDLPSRRHDMASKLPEMPHKYDQDKNFTRLEFFLHNQLKSSCCH